MISLPRFSCFVPLVHLVSCSLLLGMVQATEERLFTVYQPLATSPEIEIVAVTYLTSFGAIEESTVAGVAWPALLGAGQEGTRSSDLNLASILGVGVNLEFHDDGPWTITVDVSHLKPLPKSLREERLMEEIGRQQVLEKTLQAIERNLVQVGVFDCPLVVTGVASQEDLKDWHYPKTLNRAESVWGPWTFKALPSRYDEGSLHAFAAQSLFVHSKLSTIFLIAAGERFTKEAEAEMASLLQSLLIRIGDDAFGEVLRQAEDEVRDRVQALLKTGDPKFLERYPKTAVVAVKEKESPAKLSF